MFETSEVVLPQGVTLADLTAEAGRGIAHVLDPRVLDALTDGQSVGALQSVEDLGRIVDAARLLLAGRAAVRAAESAWPAQDGLLMSTGCRTEQELLCRATGVSHREAARRVAAARPLTAGATVTGEPLPARLPALAAATAAGLIGADARDLIARCLAPLQDRARPGDLAEAERCLTAAAAGGAALQARAGLLGRRLDREGLCALLEVAPRAACDGADGRDGADGAGVFAPPATYRELEIMARAWVLAVDPDGPEPREEEAVASRGLTLGRLRNGLVPLRGLLLPEVAAQLQRDLDACLSPRAAEATTAGGEAADALDDGSDGDIAPDRERRSPAQKRHDALATVVRIAAGASEMPLLGGAPPTLVLTAALEDLADPRGVAFLAGTHDEQACAVPVQAAHHAACAGVVQRVLLDAGGAILGLTASTTRIFTPAQRRAIIVRDGTCCIPGCEVPATWCELHHVREWQDGGPTDTSNGIALCWYHHRYLGQHGWQIRVHNGVPQVKAPAWINPAATWQDTSGGLHRARTRARTRLRPRTGTAGRPRDTPGGTPPRRPAPSPRAAAPTGTEPATPRVEPHLRR